MARFDVFRDRDGLLFLDVRAGQVQRLANYVLVSLMLAATVARPMRGLNPILEVNGEPYLMMTQLIAATPRTAFSQFVDNLDRHWDDITRALDVLFTGF